MKVIKQAGNGGFAIEFIYDTEAIKELIDINKNALMGMFIKAVNGYKKALANNKFLKPNGNSLAYRITLEFGDMEDFDSEVDEESILKEYII